MTSPARREALQHYLEDIRDRMRLQAWDIYVSDTPADDDETLNIDPQIKTHWAKIHIGSFFELDDDIVNSREHQRQSAVHELVHCWQADLIHWLAEGKWRLPIAPDNVEQIEDFVVTSLEVQADAVARILAESMPMPPEWPE